jgi:hypothetical protein
MYSGTLLLHSWLRWAVIVLGIVAFLRALGAGGRAWTAADDKPGLWFTIALDVQFLIGLALYLFISPNTTAALHDVGASMHVASVRFWLVEHPFGMIVALILAHVGRIRTRGAAADRKGRAAAIFYGLALAIILLTQPWPGLPYGRPLFRF